MFHTDEYTIDLSEFTGVYTSQEVCCSEEITTSSSGKQYYIRKQLLDAIYKQIGNSAKYHDKPEKFLVM